MSSRAVRQFRARNPNQHQLLTGLVVERQLTLLERCAKPYMMRGASPGLDQVDGEERGRAKRRTRGGKTVTWSKTLLQVSSINSRSRINFLISKLKYSIRCAVSVPAHLAKQLHPGLHLDPHHLGHLHLD